MGRSTIVTVDALATPMLIATTISINVSPVSGVVPLRVDIGGRLTDVSGTPLVDKTINLYCNGVFLGSTITSEEGEAGAPGGDYAFGMTIITVGQYQFQTEFPGDATYEGCAVHNGTLGLVEGGEASPVSLLKVGLVLIAVVGGGTGAYYVLKGGVTHS